MAKSSRASSIKTNNAALKSKVFGPAETARTERLSAKLMELVSQPKPERAKEDTIMEASKEDAPSQQVKRQDAMEVDEDPTTTSKESKSGKGRIERKKSSRKASMVFPKYKKGSRVSKPKTKSRK